MNLNTSALSVCERDREHDAHGRVNDRDCGHVRDHARAHYRASGRDYESGRARERVRAAREYEYDDEAGVRA